MRIMKTPSNEYYLAKTGNSSLGALVFRACATGKHGQSINLSVTSVPKELFGKKLLFKVEVKDETT